ncbi:MAG TPA: YbjN domain-containing protein [Blastocatellia bacterium]|nr:YbjN domain-containing protein [Blastocatellia bacterium]
MMEFKTEAHKRVYEKTRNFANTLFGEINVKAIDDSLVLQEGSTFVYLRVFPIGDKKAGVEVFSYVVVDVELTEELMRYLLTYNLKLILGGFGVATGEDGRAVVLLTHTILGDTMDREELYASVSAIARVADDLDDQIVTAFGGKTALNKLMSSQSPPEIWE